MTAKEEFTDGWVCCSEGRGSAFVSPLVRFSMLLDTSSTSIKVGVAKRANAFSAPGEGCAALIGPPKGVRSYVEATISSALG
jgi:hypothetical protein